MKILSKIVASTAVVWCLLTALLSLVGQSSSANDEVELKVGSLRVGKILFLGNSITLHGPKADIGWSGDWGMAASSREKDYVHQLVSRIEKVAGGKPQIKVRNIADFERQLGDYKIDQELKAELEFKADVVILAIGENSAAPKTDTERERFSNALNDLLAQLKHHGAPKIFVRSQFWPDAEKDKRLKQACDQAGGTFIDIGKLGGDPANAARAERQIEHAGVAGHPGDKGMSAIADQLWAAIQDAAKPPPATKANTDKPVHVEDFRQKVSSLPGDAARGRGLFDDSGQNTLIDSISTSSSWPRPQHRRKSCAPRVNKRLTGNLRPTVPLKSGLIPVSMTQPGVLAPEDLAHEEPPPPRSVPNGAEATSGSVANFLSKSLIAKHSA